MTFGKLFVGVAGAVVGLLGSYAPAEVKLSPLFMDHAVLQRDRPLVIFGRGDHGEHVTVRFAGQSASSVVDENGTWQVRLAPVPASDMPTTLSVEGPQNTVTASDVVVGDVWLCSGQSNMAFKVSGAMDAEKEIADSTDGMIRQMSVRYTLENEPATMAKGAWAPASPKTVGDFTAVGYFFAQGIRRNVKVPVGIISSSVGGTPIEAWTPRDAIQGSEFSFVATTWQKRLDDYPAAKEKYDAAVAANEKKAAEAKAAGKPYKAPWIPKPAKAGELHQDQPSGLYNGMIAPLEPVAMRGVLWYQGESNVTQPEHYRQLFPTMIEAWRGKFEQPDLPFYWVQLSSFIYSAETNTECAQLRDVQTATLAVAHTGQAISYDIGLLKNIHPTNKQEVGRRLALVALKRTYGRDVDDTGPVRDKVDFADDHATVAFADCSGRLTARQGEILGFELAGDDQVYHPATAGVNTAAGNVVVVRSREVPKPVAVRYAWRNFTTANLTDASGLPAFPFRSDDWNK